MERVYVVIGVRGLLKVGRTSNFEQRLNALRQAFKAKGDVVRAYHASPEIYQAYGPENTLIDHLTRTACIAFGREWFTGADFEDVVARADKVTAEFAHIKPPTAKQLAARARQYAEMRSAMEAERARAEASRRAYLAGLERRRAIRQRRQSVIADIACFLSAEGAPAVRTPSTTQAEG